MGKSLFETLSDLGYTTRKARVSMCRPRGAKHIKRDGETVFTGNAGEVWGWLRETKQLKEKCDEDLSV